MIETYLLLQDAQINTFCELNLDCVRDHSLVCVEIDFFLQNVNGQLVLCVNVASSIKSKNFVLEESSSEQFQSLRNELSWTRRIELQMIMKSFSNERVNFHFEIIDCNWSRLSFGSFKRNWSSNLSGWRWRLSQGLSWFILFHFYWLRFFLLIAIFIFWNLFFKISLAR